MTKVKSIFVSDAHIGSAFFRSDALLDVFKEYQAEKIYLVGDFIDGWKFKRGFAWTNSASQLIRKITELSESGQSEVFYSIGNHDEFLRQIEPLTMGSIKIAEEFIHETINGKKLLVKHGDYLDKTVKNMPWIAHFGDRILSCALWISSCHRWIEKKIGFKYWSFSNWLKRNMEGAINAMSNFKILMVKDAKRRNFDGVVCGHIHEPGIEDDGNGFVYYNCGDWVEHCTYIIEDMNGNIELLTSPFASLVRRVEAYDWPG